MIEAKMEHIRYCCPGEMLFRLTVKGHAGAGPKGHDIVCSAVSTLVETLASWATEDPDDCINEKLIDLKDGEATIEVHTGIFGSIEAMPRFSFVAYGLKNISEQYPEFVKFKAIIEERMEP